MGLSLSLSVAGALRFISPVLTWPPIGSASCVACGIQLSILHGRLQRTLI